MYLLAPFMLQNFYKKILNQSYEDVRHFWDQNSQFLLNKIFGTTLCYYFHLPIGRKVFHLPQNKIFVWKTITVILSYLLADFIVQNFKKILPADPELWACAIYGSQNDPFPQIRIFSENLLMSLVSFIHAYLHARNQSQILIY